MSWLEIGMGTSASKYLESRRYSLPEGNIPQGYVAVGGCNPCPGPNDLHWTFVASVPYSELTKSGTHPKGRTKQACQSMMAAVSCHAPESTSSSTPEADLQAAIARREAAAAVLAEIQAARASIAVGEPHPSAPSGPFMPPKPLPPQASPAAQQATTKKRDWTPWLVGGAIAAKLLLF